MCLESSLVLVNFIDPNPVGVLSILNDIKSQATRLIVCSTASVRQLLRNEPVSISWLYLNRHENDIHIWAGTGLVA